MFVTTHNFAVPVPRTLREPAADYWAAFRLSNEAPWFLITLSLASSEGDHTQTVGVAWESTLRNLIETYSEGVVLTIRRLSSTDRGAGSWRMEDVSEVWRPAPSEEEFAGPVLFRFGGQTELRDAFCAVVKANVPGRKLLVRTAA